MFSHAPHNDWISDAVEAADWVIGAVNYDEDLHFSSYYLRASASDHTMDMYPGYSLIAGFYTEFAEKYFLLEHECVENARYITERALEDPGWLHEILAVTRDRSDELLTLFAGLPRTALRQCGRSEAAELYARHHEVHSRLYEVARIPEALDRGVLWFSTYLREHLVSCGVPAAEVEGVFATATQPVSMSVLAQELAEFEQIVALVRANSEVVAAALAVPTKVQLVLPSNVIVGLEAHRKKWGYLAYHGYGRRRASDIGEYCERLVTALARSRDAGVTTPAILERLEANLDAREALFDAIELDVGHRSLFRAYPEMGWVKLYRRLAQLRNFYYLDALLGRIAVLLGVDEWSVRCMLPEEILGCLRDGESIPDGIRQRRVASAFVIAQGYEEVLVGSGARVLRKVLESRTQKSVPQQRVLKGIVASGGKVTGTCKIVIRGDAEAERIKEGAVLVSGSTDPDLLGALQLASAVLTEEGGVTSHAALIARELGIPAIVGVRGLLDAVRDGDVVEVDATTGVVRFVDSALAEPPTGLTHEGSDLDDATIVGAKACNLERARRAGFNVPPLVVLNATAIREFLITADAPEKDRFIEWVARRLSLERTDTVAIRSSAITEDLASGSRAGFFRSRLNVVLGEVWPAIVTFIEENDALSFRAEGTGYAGGIIVQPMIAPSISGVCITCDERVVPDAVIIEYSADGTSAVTDGSATPSRIVVDRATRDVLDEATAVSVSADWQGVPLGEAVNTFLRLEEGFGYPADIEWAIVGGSLLVLQVRPVVFYPRRS